MINVTILENGTAISDDNEIYNISGFRKGIAGTLLIDSAGHSSVVFAGQKYQAYIENNEAILKMKRRKQ